MIGNYATSDDYVMFGLWRHIVASLRELAKNSGFKLRGRGAKSKSMMELVIDLTFPGQTCSSIPLVVRVGGSYITQGDGEYCVHMQSPHIVGTHQDHQRLTGTPKADANTIAQAIWAMVDDMRTAYIQQRKGE